jgi:hypothetical protein
MAFWRRWSRPASDMHFDVQVGRSWFELSLPISPGVGDALRLPLACRRPDFLFGVDQNRLVYTMCAGGADRITWRTAKVAPTRSAASHPPVATDGRVCEVPPTRSTTKAVSRACSAASASATATTWARPSAAARSRTSGRRYPPRPPQCSPALSCSLPRKSQSSKVPALRRRHALGPGDAGRSGNRTDS